MKLRIVFLAALMGLSFSAFAANPAPAAGTGAGPMKDGMCKQSPDQCTQLAAKFDQWCGANADKCTDMKAHFEKRREWCESNKEKCQEMMQKMHEHHRGQKQDQDSGDDDDTSSPPA